MKKNSEERGSEWTCDVWCGCRQEEQGALCLMEEIERLAPVEYSSSWDVEIVRRICESELKVSQLLEEYAREKQVHETKRSPIKHTSLSILKKSRV